MKALRNHKGLATVAVSLLLALVGSIVYITVSGNDNASDAGNKTNTSDAKAHRPPVKNPSDIKPGTKVPGSPTSTSSTPPSSAASDSAPKVAPSR